jgi:hypothetical protein
VKDRNLRRILPLVWMAAMILPACQGLLGHKAATSQPVPYPVSLMLPKSISLHPFTGMRVFDEAGGIKGIDVRIEAKDAYDDTTRAFGDFRFELYTFRTNNVDPKNVKIASWDVPLTDSRANRLHWDNITRTYKFRLQWGQAIAVGERFVLVVTFSSPFTERIFAERVFIAGQ